MARALIDLLWRHHPSAPRHGARGPRSRQRVDDVIEAAIRLADEAGLPAATVRAIGTALDIAPMSVYTHVNSRDDLLVLMADRVCLRMRLPAFGRSGWRTRLRRLAEANLALFREHPWLLEIRDPRLAVGPGTIAKYDHELRAFDGLGLSDLDRDAGLTFVLDFVRASAVAMTAESGESFVPFWADSAARLGEYVGESHPLARRVGAAAGAALQAPYSSAHAWTFGLGRIVDSFATQAGADDA